MKASDYRDIGVLLEEREDTMNTLAWAEPSGHGVIIEVSMRNSAAPWPRLKASLDRLYPELRKTFVYDLKNRLREIDAALVDLGVEVNLRQLDD